MLLSLLVIWSREQLLVRVGQFVSETRLNRLDFKVEDADATMAKRLEASENAPRIYTTNDDLLDRLQASLGGLPTAVSGQTDPTALASELQDQYQLNEFALSILQDMTIEGEATPQWQQWVQQLVEVELRNLALLEDQEYMIYQLTAPNRRQLQMPDGRTLTLAGESTSTKQLNASNPPERLRQAVSRVGFPEAIIPTIAGRIARDGQPTIMLDAAETDRLREERSAAVKPVVNKHDKGDVIWKRGDEITAENIDAAIQEREYFRNSGSFIQRWLPRIGIVTLLAILSVFMAAYAVSSHERIGRNPFRLIALCFLIAAMLAVTTWVTVEAPAFLFPATIAPLLFTVVVVRLAYDRRLAVIMGCIQAAIATKSLQGIGWFILMMAGVGAMIAQITEVRHRNSLIRASLVTAAVLAIGCVVLNMIELPQIFEAWGQVTLQAVQSAVASLAIGFLVLGILPSIEQVFGITTGMTLAELRDPRRPLLQQLQQRAPGHTTIRSRWPTSRSRRRRHRCRQSAHLCGRHHDIGKMNKPTYFVENQQPGDVLDKLSPAMSLLVIIGHVKDGIELAKEYNLPREIVHFIESHHGSTLVEYFYAEKQKADDEGREAVDEIEFTIRDRDLEPRRPRSSCSATA